MFSFFFTIFHIIWKQLNHNAAVVFCFPSTEARLKKRGRRCSPQALAIRRPPAWQGWPRGVFKTVNNFGLI